MLGEYFYKQLYNNNNNNSLRQHFSKVSDFNLGLFLTFSPGN